MPVDLTILFNTSRFLTLRHPGVDYEQLNGDEDDDDEKNDQNRRNGRRRRKNGEVLDDATSPYEPSNHICRRAASFPTLNLRNKRHSLLVTSDLMNQKCSSESEIRDESKTILNGLTLDDLKRQFAALIIERVDEKRVLRKDDDRTTNHDDRPFFNNDNDYEDDVDDGGIHHSHYLLDHDDQEGGVSTENDENLRRRKSSAKKKVSFADDNGHTLAIVRVMAEPSDVPPVLTSPTALAIIAAHDPDSDSMHNPFLPGTALLSAANFNGSPISPSTSTPTLHNWRLDFKQPASDYMRFRVKLEAKNVALENVLIDNVKGRLNGTIKVKNLSFEKFVFVRYTVDQWKTFRDETAQYVQPSSKHTSRPDMVDTFRFDFEIPPDDNEHRNLEFCVCFRLSTNNNNRQEFWDSNNENGNGANFKISSSKFSTKISSPKLDRRSHSDSKLSSRRDPTVGSGDDSSDGESTSSDLKLRSKNDDDDSMLDMDGDKSLRVKRRMRRRRLSNDAFELQMDNWSEFSTWKHLDSPGPYW